MSSILHLYAVRAGNTDMVKIGISRNPRRRIIQMQTDIPLDLDVIFFLNLKGTSEDVEQRIHSALADRQIRGEWFSIPTDDEVWEIVKIVVGPMEWSEETYKSLPNTTPRSRKARQQWMDKHIASQDIAPSPPRQIRSKSFYLWLIFFFIVAFILIRYFG